MPDNRLVLYQTLFVVEVDVLRGMAKLNDAQCPPGVYVHQYKLVKALKEALISVENEPTEIVQLACENHASNIFELLGVLGQLGIHVSDYPYEKGS